MNPNVNAPDHQINLDISDELEVAGDVEALIDHLDRLLLAETMPDPMRQAIADWIELIPLDDGGTRRVTEAIALVVTSPEFAVQR